MKRILPVILVLALTLAFMITPAFADESHIAEDNPLGIYWHDHHGPFVSVHPGDGQYQIVIDAYREGSDTVYSIDTVVQFVKEPGGFFATFELYYEDDESVLLYLYIYDDLQEQIVLQDDSYDWVITNFQILTYSPAGQPGLNPEEGGIVAMVESVVEAIFAVFAAIGNWFVEFLPTLTAIFWSGEGLTFIGVLAVLGLGVSVIFLLINVIRGFLNFSH